MVLLRVLGLFALWKFHFDVRLLYIGIGITVGQVYLSEISPASIRGLVGTFFELGVVGFIFLSEILGIPEVGFEFL